MEDMTQSVGITQLLRRGPESRLAALLVFAAMLPHLVLEATAYVLASLSAIFLSQGLFKYALADPILRSVARAALAIALAAAATLVVAGLLESTLPGLVLSWLAPAASR